MRNVVYFFFFYYYYLYHNVVKRSNQSLTVGGEERGPVWTNNIFY